MGDMHASTMAFRIETCVALRPLMCRLQMSVAYSVPLVGSHFMISMKLVSGKWMG